MEFYLAPLEGITGFVYRNAYEKYFGNADKYFAPFISPDKNICINRKEKRDVLPENNHVPKLVPQIMTNNPKHFSDTAKELSMMGYDEVNLNLGCPAATVVTKKKGAGFLFYPEELDEFFYNVFDNCRVKISIKTRLGKESADEFYQLIEIYNKYPFEEIIIHPRIRNDFYNNKPNLEVFKDALRLSKNRVVYNGDIHSVKDYQQFVKIFPDVSYIMFGRGVLKNPALICSIKSFEGSGNVRNGKLDMQVVKKFMDKIQRDYYSNMRDERNVLFKLKELWLYMHESFENGDKYWKKIKKAKNFEEYDKAVSVLFGESRINTA